MACFYSQLLFFTVYFLAVNGRPFSNLVTPPPVQDVYEFWLTVNSQLSMSIWEDDHHASIIYLNVSGDQKYYYRTDSPNPGCKNYQEYTGDISTLIVGDGRHRQVISVNDSIPAPTLIVFNGSRVLVHVTNRADDPVSVHFHGLEHRGSFFMDGASSLTQCPIAVGQTFTYDFRITDPPGTYWYHGHNAMDLNNGLFGAFIVLDRNQAKTGARYQELVAVINDWYEHTTDYYFSRLRNDEEMFLPDYENRDTCYSGTLNTVGAPLGVAPWNSALINGLGWHNVSELKTYPSRLPLEELHAQSATDPVKIRLINAGMIYGLLFSIDDHKLTVVAADSRDIKPVESVDYVHLSQGERFDVILQPTMNTTMIKNRSFLIRIRSMEKMNSNYVEQKDLDDHFGLAWLVYDQGSPKTRGYTEENRGCSAQKPCIVVNCPFGKYPQKYNRTCINFDTLRSIESDDGKNEILKPSAAKFESHFLNLGFEEDRADTINGIQYRHPTIPPFMGEGGWKLDQECGQDCGSTKRCSCTHQMNFKLGNVVELVIYNAGYGVTDAKSEMGHPFHVHGHHFYVVKVGWPTYKTEGLADKVNTEVICDPFLCTWTNQSLKSTSPWPIVSQDGYKPVLKDTIHVPYGGYVVIRFKADNAGLWMAHCHILPHHMNGMAMFFREGAVTDLPVPPDNFPTCGVPYGKTRLGAERPVVASSPVGGLFGGLWNFVTSIFG